jgi:hypothetical protein
VSDAAATKLAALVRGGGAEAEAVCRALAERGAPRFGGRGWSRLSRALLRASTKPSAPPSVQSALSENLMRGPSKRYLERKQDERAAAASTGILRRALSVFTRAWVILVFGFAALFLGSAILSDPAEGLYPALGLITVAASCIVVDARLRRCPSCGKPLAGWLLSLVRDDYGGHVRTWQCVFCRRRWRT